MWWLLCSWCFSLSGAEGAVPRAGDDMLELHVAFWYDPQFKLKVLTRSGPCRNESCFCPLWGFVGEMIRRQWFCR